MSITLNIWRIPAKLICNYFTHSFVQILFVNNKSMVILVLAEAKRAGGWCWAWMHPLIAVLGKRVFTQMTP